MLSYLGGAGGYGDAVNKAVSSSEKCNYLLPAWRFWLSLQFIWWALFCPLFLLWAYRAMARASIASSTGARVQKCVVSENVIHLCSPAGGFQAVLLLYQLLSGEWSVKTAARITAASLVDQENKTLRNDAHFLCNFFPWKSSYLPSVYVSSMMAEFIFADKNEGIRWISFSWLFFSPASAGTKSCSFVSR